jgi:DNA-binding MarR family transcriptional regulator
MCRFQVIANCIETSYRNFIEDHGGADEWATFEAKARKFNSNVVQRVVQAMSPGATITPGDNELASELWNEQFEPPFLVFPFHVSHPYSHLVLPSKHAGIIGSVLRTTQMYAGCTPFILVFQSYRTTLVGHNMPGYALSGRVLAHDAKSSRGPIYLDSFRPWIELIKPELQADSLRVQTDELRPKRFARIGGSILEQIDALGKPEWQLYLTMVLHANYRTRTLTMGQREMARKANLSSSAIPKTLQKLAALGLLTERREAQGQRTFTLPLIKGDRKPAYLNVPDWVIACSQSLTKTHWRAYIAACSLASFRTGVITASQQDIAERARMRDTHLVDAMNHLVRSGILIREKHIRTRSATFWIPGPGHTVR